MKRLFRQFLKEEQPPQLDYRGLTAEFNKWLYSKTTSGRRFNTTDRGAIKRNIQKWWVRLGEQVVKINPLFNYPVASKEWYMAL